jgi:hypothetical protein
VVLVAKKTPEPQFGLADLGDRRVLTIGGREYVTRYSARVIRMLIERKGVARTSAGSARAARTACGRSRSAARSAT